MKGEITNCLEINKGKTSYQCDGAQLDSGEHLILQLLCYQGINMTNKGKIKTGSHPKEFEKEKKQPKK